MNLLIRYMILRLFVVVLLLSLSQASAQEKRPLTYQELTFTTSAYRDEALRLLIKEANQAASELNLPEKLPITESNLVDIYISPPRLGRAAKTFGMIATSNYVYSAAVDNKLSYIVKNHLQNSYDKLQGQYLWSMGKMDTNAAYQTATQILNAASMDVKALNRDCNVAISAFTPEGKEGTHFVPVYWITWKNRNGGVPIASIELFEPTKTLRQLRVTKSEYISRKPLEVTNLVFLLSQTNAPPVTK
jgi:hypothetical protein